ncbi:MAG: hypothetical protein CSYNP_00692 [Syntrophus sp. SKADARSKE-3]|nr:hypothetical protein [Syntrophus sp. SKADARSKE-3]
MRFGRVFRNFNVLNVLLALAVMTSFFFTTESFYTPILDAPLSPAQESFAGSTTKPPMSPNTSAIDYAIISDENLFHPERRIPPLKKVETVVIRPEVILYGIVISDNMGIAFVEDKKAPQTTPGRGKRQIALRQGEQFGGYVLQRIEANHIMLARGNDKFFVKLEEGEKRKNFEMASDAAFVSKTLTQQSDSKAERHTLSAATQSLYPASMQPPAAITGLVPGSLPQSRQARLLEVQQRKQEMKSQFR